jgi:subtilisin-like proprotein convertase family protein
LLESSSEPFVTIPDDDPEGVSDEIWIDGSGTVTGIEVDVSATHDLPNELELELVSPLGSSAVLSSSDLGTTYDVTNTPTLGDFEGETAEGYWRLRIRDVRAGDEGTLDNWSLRIASS